MHDDLFGLYSRHVLCVVGVGLDFESLASVITNAGGADFTLDPQYCQNTPDEDMPMAFKACLTNATFTERDTAAVAEHDSVGYILSPPIRPGTAIDIAGRTLAVTAALLRAGGTAVKNESSGLTHGRDRWLELAADAAETTEATERAEIMYHAWVKRPILSQDLLISCGMHLLGEPDVELAVSNPRDPDLIAERVGLIDALAVYLLTEQDAHLIEEGAGFRIAAGEPRWTLHHRSCERYEPDDLYANLAGYLRLVPSP